MAINGINKKAKVQGKTPTSAPGVWGNLVHQPPPFRATGKGWFNTLPDFPASAKNANGCLLNQGADPTQGTLYKTYLFVNGIETGWQLAGERAQTVTSRSFYPRNLTQDEMSIYGQMANQHEFDRLVEFVLHHQHTILKADDVLDEIPAVRFTLFRPVAGRTFDHFRALSYQVAVTDIEAGAERFKNAPEFRITCKVLNDYLQTKPEVQDQFSRKIDYKSIFGDYTNPDPSISGTAPETNASTTNAKLKSGLPG